MLERARQRQVEAFAELLRVRPEERYTATSMADRPKPGSPDPVRMVDPSPTRGSMWTTQRL